LINAIVRSCSHFWAIVCKNDSPYAIGLLSVCPVCPVLSVCLWRSCTVAKQLDGSRRNLACR